MFFSSRRRHTRWPRDWSSDVCSSDLAARDGRLLDHFYAFSTLHARVHTHSVLQALLVFVLQRPLKRQIQYQIEAQIGRASSRGRVQKAGGDSRSEEKNNRDLVQALDD